MYAYYVVMCTISFDKIFRNWAIFHTKEDDISIYFQLMCRFKIWNDLYLKNQRNYIKTVARVKHQKQKNPCPHRKAPRDWPTNSTRLHILIIYFTFTSNCCNEPWINNLKILLLLDLRCQNFWIFSHQRKQIKTVAWMNPSSCLCAFDHFLLENISEKTFTCRVQLNRS